MIALLAAHPLETVRLRQDLTLCQVSRHHSLSLYRGYRSGLEILLLHSGVGKANMAAASAFLFACGEQPSAMINFGCGGAYAQSGLSIGDLVLATEEVYGDEGALAHDGFLDMQQLGFPLVEQNGLTFFNRFPADPVLFSMARPILVHFASANGRQLVTGPCVTVSTCSGTAEAGSVLAQRTGGLCENMEGAAAAQICTRFGVPFLEIRGISNHVEDRNLVNWDIAAGADVAQRAVLELLTAWPQHFKLS